MPYGDTHFKPKLWGDKTLIFLLVLSWIVLLSLSDLQFWCHTDAKPQFLSEKFNYDEIYSNIEFEFSRQKWDYWELDYLNKN